MKIDFSIETEYGTFTDALYLSDDIVYSEEEIEAMKQERVSNWVQIAYLSLNNTDNTIVHGEDVSGE